MPVCVVGNVPLAMPTGAQWRSLTVQDKELPSWSVSESLPLPQADTRLEQQGLTHVPSCPAFTEMRRCYLRTSQSSYAVVSGYNRKLQVQAKE